MSINNFTNPTAYGFTDPLIPVINPPILAQTAPTINDFAPLGTEWIDQSTNDIYFLANIVGNNAIWTVVSTNSSVLSSLTVNPGPTSITGTTLIDGNINAPGVVTIQETGGAASTIVIESTSGTGAASVGISSSLGGIEISTASTAPAGDMVISTNGGGTLSLGSTGDTGTNDLLINLNGGTASKMLINNELGTASDSVVIQSVVGGVEVVTVAAGKNVNISANDGSVALTGGEDSAQAIFISAGGGTAATMEMINLTGTNSAATIANSSLYLASTSGGIGINAGEDINMESATTSTITSGGVITISSTDNTGSDVQILANSNGGGVIIEATGTSGAIELRPSTTLEMAHSATVTTIDIGNITPTVSRTTTINGAVVNTAHTDLVSIADGGVSTSGSAEKEVTIATGATAVGLTLVSIATGNVSAAGNTTLNLATGNAPAGTTQAINIGTGTGGGTKSISMGNVDGNTTLTALGIVDINNSGSAATVIGSTATGGAVNIKSANVITVQSADTTGSDIAITATGAGGGVVATTGSGGFNINATGTGVTTIGSVATGGAVALNSSSTITSLAPNVNINNSGTGATTIGSTTGGTIIAESNTASATAIQLNAHNAAGGITATVGTGNFVVTGGNLSMATAAKGIVFQAGPTIVSGSGSPSTVVTAPKGSLYLRTDGSGVNDRMFVNTDGATAWTAVVTVA